MQTSTVADLWKTTVCAALMAALLFSATSVQARYLRPDLEKVPVDRLVKNLQQMVEKDPKDVQTRFHLARLHAMAYALKTDTAQVRKGKEKDGAWFGYEPRPVPFKVEETKDAEKLKEAREHLNKALQRYEEVIKAKPDHLIALLGRAWCIQQQENKEKTIAEYRKVIETAWAKEKTMKVAPLGWHPVTAEAAGYLIPLLDKEKDNKEIEELQERIKFVKRIPRPITPVAIPLRDGMTLADVVNPSARVTFDADGSGLQRTWTWIHPQAGWLVHDPRDTRKITSALQMFGSVTFWLFWDNGYEALAALDDNRDGVVSDRELEGLAIWQDLNSNGISETGEVKSLAEWGIVALAYNYTRGVTNRDQIPYVKEGVIFRDGTRRSSYDVTLHQR